MMDDGHEDQSSQNPFIRAMEASGEWSEAKLKALFRRASKRVHPDAGKGISGEAFIRLKRKYDEALSAIAARDGESGQRLGPARARRTLLAALNRFTVKIFTDEADGLLDSMVKAAAAYRPELAALLARYRSEIYGRRGGWANDANRYYAHSIVFSAARQLFFYYETGKALHKNLVVHYRESMAVWTRTIPQGFTEILLRLYDWVESELDGERVQAIP